MSICESIEPKTKFTDAFGCDIFGSGVFAKPIKKTLKVKVVILDGFLTTIAFDFEVFEELSEVLF